MTDDATPDRAAEFGLNPTSMEAIRLHEEGEQRARAHAAPEHAAIARRKIVGRLAENRVDASEMLIGWYRADPMECSRWCDKEADRSGNLLGWLREAAR